MHFSADLQQPAHCKMRQEISLLIMCYQQFEGSLLFCLNCCMNVRFSKSKRDGGLCDEGENLVINGKLAMRSSVSTKRRRAADNHNESERVRNLISVSLLTRNDALDRVHELDNQANVPIMQVRPQ
jgi:hypothetical protein